MTRPLVVLYSTGIPKGILRPSYGRDLFITLSRTDPEMRRPDHTKCFGPAAYVADMARVRVRASYLLGRWAQAPISDPVREADT